MMSLQARERIPGGFRTRQGLRAYPVDSPRAKARLLIVAMFADGRLDGKELETLVERGAFAELGISRDDFLSVLFDFSADLSGLPKTGFDVAISPRVLQSLLAEISDDAQKLAMLRLIFDVIRSDGRLDPAEARFFWSALDAWSLRIEDGRRRAADDSFPGLRRVV